MFSVFANFRIDTPERLDALKISFKSFNDKRIKNWVINIRGEYKSETKKYLIQKCKSKIKVFHFESSKGWMYDSNKIIKFLKSELVLFWVEDHICLKNRREYLFECAKDMKKNDVDQMLYSFWHGGDELKGLMGIIKNETKNIVFYNLNKYSLKTRDENRAKLGLEKIGFIINAVSIFKKKIFFKIIKTRKPWKRRYNKLLPFDFEKRSEDKFWLPINLGISKKEIFASLDDDHGEKGYSLISRKIYSKIFSRNIEVKKREGNLKQKKKNYIGKITYFIRNQFDIF
tara:strand:+ start:814 stop:1671 length:858 start_codon:yes stop_codon:yes gene_type:complete